MLGFGAITPSSRSKAYSSPVVTPSRTRLSRCCSLTASAASTSCRYRSQYYLTGSAIAVIGILPGGRPPRQAPGEASPADRRPERRHRSWRRSFAGRPGPDFLFALVTGVTNNATGFGFPAIWLWVGLVVGLTVLNVIFGGLWRLGRPVAAARPDLGSRPQAQVG